MLIKRLKKFVFVRQKLLGLKFKKFITVVCAKPAIIAYPKLTVNDSWS